MWSNKLVSLSLTGISGLAICTNFKSYQYIKHTFNVKDNLFNILSKDSLVTGTLTILYFVANIIHLVNEDALKSKIGCGFSFIGLWLPSMMGPFWALLITLRRFVQLRYPTLVPHNSLKINCLTSLIIIVLVFYFTTILMIDLLKDLRQLNYIEHCLGRQEKEGKSQLFGIVTVGMPQLIVLIGTVVLDLFNHITIVKTIEANKVLKTSEQERRRLEKIPKRATIINSCMFIPFLSFTFIILNVFDLSMEIKALLVNGGNILVIAARNPVIARFAFQVNQQIQKESVEKRRQIEIQEALERKQERDKPLELLDV